MTVQLPFWNGCDEDDHCIPDLALQSSNDLMTRKWVHLFINFFSKREKERVILYFRYKHTHTPLSGNSTRLLCFYLVVSFALRR